MDEELKKQLTAMLDDFKKGLPVGISADEMKSALEKFKEENAPQVTKEDFDKLTNALKIQGEKMTDFEKKGFGEQKEISLVDQITNEIKALGVNSVSELKSYLDKNGKKDIEIKAISAVASTANTDTVGRTNLDVRVNWTPTVRAAFLPYFRTIAESSDKSRFGYTEGSYTGSASYVGQGTGNSNSDSASASAQFMEYAKVQSVLSVNTEVYEDIPDFAQGLVTQMQIAMQKFVDDEAYTGDGLAPSNVQHIKGLKAYATEAEFTSGKNMVDYATSVVGANTADLISAVKTYIDNLPGSYMADVVYMNPVDLFKMNRLKDSTGQPIVNKDLFGNPTIGGIVVRTSSKIAKNTLLVLDSAVVEWRTKRTLKLQMGQLLANDAINDKQSAILSARYQLLVRNADKPAVVKVSNIESAIDAITIAS